MLPSKIVTRPTSMLELPFSGKNPRKWCATLLYIAFLCEILPKSHHKDISRLTSRWRFCIARYSLSALYLLLYPWKGQPFTATSSKETSWVFKFHIPICVLHLPSSRRRRITRKIFCRFENRNWLTTVDMLAVLQTFVVSYFKDNTGLGITTRLTSTEAGF